MLLNAQGWIEHPDFIRIDGIADKVYTKPNSGDGGLACHSIVGEEADTQDGVPNRFLSTEKVNGQYTKNAAASCIFILRKRAKHIQMYPITASTWTTGGMEANTTTWPMEAEGGPPSNTAEALTKHQEDGFLVIATAWEQLKGRKLVVGETVRSHRQIAIAFNYPSTACESGRYRNAWARLAKGERYGSVEITEERIRAIAREEAEGAMKMALAIDNQHDVRIDAFRRLLDLAMNGGQGQFADTAGNPLPLIRDRDILSRVGALEAASEGHLDPGEVPDHTHEVDLAFPFNTGGVNYESEEPDPDG